MSERLSACQFLSAGPAVGGVVRTVGTEPVESRNLVERQLVAAVESAVVGERSSERHDASTDGVFPYRIFVRVEILVDDHVWLLDFGMCGRSPRQFERLEDVPSDGEVAVPEELLREGDWQFRACIDVTQLLFVIVAHDVGVEREALRQVVEVLSLDDVEPFRLALHLLERLPCLVLWRVVIG